MYKGRTERILGSFWWQTTKMAEKSDLEVRLSEVLMKEIVVNILVEIIREEMAAACSIDFRESLLNDIDRFRVAIVKRMTTDEVRSPKDTFKVDGLPDAFRAAWEAWKTARDGPTGHVPLDELRQEEVSYRAFLDTIQFKSPVVKCGQ